MKIVLSWLRECCPSDLGAEELADLLTARGAEVASIDTMRPGSMLMSPTKRATNGEAGRL